MEMAAAAHLTLVGPDNEKCTVQLAPVRSARRKPNVTVTPTVVLHRLDQPLDPRYRATSRSTIECVTPSCTDSVQKLIPGLTAPAASFEATVGGSAARGSSNFFKKYL